MNIPKDFVFRYIHDYLQTRSSSTGITQVVTHKMSLVHRMRLIYQYLTENRHKKNNVWQWSDAKDCQNALKEMIERDTGERHG